MSHLKMMLASSDPLALFGRGATMQNLPTTSRWLKLTGDSAEVFGFTIDNKVQSGSNCRAVHAENQFSTTQNFV